MTVCVLCVCVCSLHSRGLSLPIEYKDARRLKACLVKMRNRTIPDKNLHYECTDCGEKFRGRYERFVCVGNWAQQ